MRNFLYLLIVVLFSGLNLWATQQDPDYIKIDGVEYEAPERLMELYLERHPEHVPTRSYSTALRRGYKAFWEIEGGKLILKELKMYMPEQQGDKSLVFRSVLRDLFPGEGPVIADWVTGFVHVYLGVPWGKVFDDDDIKYFNLLVFNEGDFVSMKSYTGNESRLLRKLQFEEFIKTEEYSALFNSLKEKAENDGKELSANKIIQEIRYKILEYTDDYLTDYEPSIDNSLDY